MALRGPFVLHLYSEVSQTKACGLLMDRDLVERKLGFASRRVEGICALIAEGRLASDVDTRHQLSQEFFLHAVGACEYVAHLANERLKLGLGAKDVTAKAVKMQVRQPKYPDLLVAAMKALHVQVGPNRFPADPYSRDGLFYRLYNYRNTVAHRGISPFQFSLREGPRIAHLHLDPSDPERGPSTASVDVDVKRMFEVVDQRCRKALNLLDP